MLTEDCCDQFPVATTHVDDEVDARPVDRSGKGRGDRAGQIDHRAVEQECALRIVLEMVKAIGSARVLANAFPGANALDEAPPGRPGARAAELGPRRERAGNTCTQQGAHRGELKSPLGGFGQHVDARQRAQQSHE